MGKKNPDSTAMVPKRDRRKWTKTGLYIEFNADGIDGRTKMGKSIRVLRDQFRDFVGKPTTVSEVLIHRIIYKVIKLSLYERAQLQNLENIEAQHYLPMSNSLRLDLQALAQIAGKQTGKVPRLEDILGGE